MRILFITDRIDFIDPLGIMLLSAVLKKQGHDVYLAVIGYKNVFEKIKEHRPQIIAYSATTGEHKHYLKINSLIKQRFPDIFTIMGGPHATFFPEAIKNSSLDAVCRGEGEEAFLDVVDAIENRRGVSSLKNIATKDKINDLRPLYQDLDLLPFADRDLFYKNTELGHFPMRSFMASRGCVYDCTYCFNHVFREIYQGKGPVLRRRSVANLIDEILQVKSRYGLEFVKFYDDIFIYSYDSWLDEFVSVYRKKVRTPFHCLMRADLINREIARGLKAAGCVSISMSVETANPYIRNGILKRNMRDDAIYNGFSIVKKEGINVFSNNIVGLPFSGIKDDLDTVEMNIRCRVDFAEFPIYHPYPRTELGELCCRENFFNGDYDALHSSYMAASPLSSFSVKDKMVRKNISLLGTAAVAFPRLKTIILKFFIYLPNNFIYFLSYLFVKMYINKTRIYPFKIKGIKFFFHLFFKGFKIDKFKHSKDPGRL